MCFYHWPIVQPEKGAQIHKQSSIRKKCFFQVFFFQLRLRKYFRAGTSIVVGEGKFWKVFMDFLIDVMDDISEYFIGKHINCVNSIFYYNEPSPPFSAFPVLDQGLLWTR